MTLQEQAQKLVDSFKPATMYWNEWDIDFVPSLGNARSCAHIAIDREIESWQDWLDVTVSETAISKCESKISELQQIKQLIEYTV
jgi:hypothetical protein